MRPIAKNAFIALNVLLLLSAGCASSHQRDRTSADDTDSETHFLQACDPECAGGLACICGVCTLVCEGGDDCQQLSDRAQCVSLDAFGNAHRCGPDHPDGQAVCEVECREDTDCESLGEGFVCASGVCRELSASDPDAGVLEPDAGIDAGSDQPYPEVLHEMCIEECDLGADGTVDRRITYTYDALGNVVRREQDFDGSGRLDLVDVYDSAGHTLISESYDADGVISSIGRHTYDEDGNKLSTDYFYDRDGDGAVEPENLTKYTYNADGKPTGELRQRLDDDDEWVNTCISYRYLEEGDLETVLTEEDELCDGTIDHHVVTTSTYDEAGNMVRQEVDEEGDGRTLEQIVTNSYFENGELERSETVMSYPDQTTAIYVAAFDEDGYRSVYEDDRDGDGEIDRRTVHEEDEQGREVRLEYTSTDEPIFDFVIGFGYVLDDEGRVLVKEWDFAGDGTVDYRDSYTYRCTD